MPRGAGVCGSFDRPTASPVLWQLNVGCGFGERRRNASARCDTKLSGFEVDTLRVMRTRFGWRIASPAPNRQVPVPSAPRVR
jgi:hypothetical protein